MDNRIKYSELMMWPHVRSAYNFARWLVRNGRDAEEIVQEASRRAFKALDTFQGSDARVWMLSIVRNTAMDLLQKRELEVAIGATKIDPVEQSPDSEPGVFERSRGGRVREAIARLEPEFREALVLREIEGLSYSEIAAVLDISTGAVMARLSRARQRLLRELMPAKEVRHELP